MNTAEEKKYKIFYSWQSDSPTNLNRNLIQTALEKAAKTLNKEVSLEPADRPEIEIDQGAQGVPGTPDLAPTILGKIAACDLFVADISFVGESHDGKKKMPNSNVLFELGYAFGKKGNTNVLYVLNTATGSPDDLPFDLRHKLHPIQYNGDSDDLAGEKDKLKKTLARAIRDVLNQTSVVLDSRPAMSIEVELTADRSQINPHNALWGFTMRYFATNLTHADIDVYSVEISVPRGILTKDGRSEFHNPQKDTETHQASVFPKAGQPPKKLLPEKRELLFTMFGLLHPFNLSNMSATLEQAIMVDMYVSGHKAVKNLQFNIRDLNPYRLLEVDEKKWSYEKTYSIDSLPYSIPNNFELKPNEVQVFSDNWLIPPSDKYFHVINAPNGNVPSAIASFFGRDGHHFFKRGQRVRFLWLENDVVKNMVTEYRDSSTSFSIPNPLL